MNIIFQRQWHQLYNINIDCIGAINGGKIPLKSMSKLKESLKLYESMYTVFEKSNIEVSNTRISEKAFMHDISVSDNSSFEKLGIANFLIADAICNFI